ncbi:MAG: hypothetical protein HKO63_09550 [Acidimicrobiia bacterium]|nr:hypothetical protein [Acidimicrobiia bacterium]MBT8248611.1 hypothetical protein [Acidimicrobiia bacterium]NNF86926.1 hypothetical protein [Acidimicrobiia bacterium]NNL12491.1 hypothetical protein [Acidimicrobiia bacterium]NNL98435.1 hypothetical protein [Acidimicrobiia bacterium]
MKRLIAGAVLLAACSSGASTDTLLAPTGAAVPDATTSTTDPPPPPVESCDPAPFVPTHLPERVSTDTPATKDIPYDQYTIISGTSTSVWSQDDGVPVLAIVRGALPPVGWLDTPEEIVVRDERAALGQLPDGVWGVAWFEGPDRCDEYTIVLYPPATAEEARMVAESVVAGERAP